MDHVPYSFTLLDFQELFGPFGPMPMWDVPMFRNYKCCCISEIRMRFGVVVFKNRSDGERAINYLNGYEAGGCKLRVDWAYPSVVQLIKLSHAPESLLGRTMSNDGLCFAIKKFVSFESMFFSSFFKPYAYGHVGYYFLFIALR